MLTFSIKTATQATYVCAALKDPTLAPIMADALEDNGCQDSIMLDAMRGNSNTHDWRRYLACRFDDYVREPRQKYLASKKYKALSRAVRRYVGATGKPWPIETVDGFKAPKLVGRSYHYENASGDLIRYPSAYRKAYGKPIYCASTKAIIVGRGWLIRKMLA